MHHFARYKFVLKCAHTVYEDIYAFELLGFCNDAGIGFTKAIIMRWLKKKLRKTYLIYLHKSFMAKKLEIENIS